MRYNLDCRISFKKNKIEEIECLNEKSTNRFYVFKNCIGKG